MNLLWTKDALEWVKALTPLAWPLLAAVLLWRLFPALHAIATSRAFTVKVAGMELSVQSATEQLRNQIEDLQKQVLALRSEPASGTEPKAHLTEPASSAAPVAPRGLWVDDKPDNNAFEIAQLEDEGIEIVQASSTEEAMAILASSRGFGFVISDMGRREGGAYRGQAGLLLLSAMRRAGFDTPFMVYSARRYADRNNAEVREAGGDGATASPIELMEWIRGLAGRGLGG